MNEILTNFALIKITIISRLKNFTRLFLKFLLHNFSLFTDQLKYKIVKIKVQFAGCL